MSIHIYMKSLVCLSDHAPCSVLSSLPRWHEQLRFLFCQPSFSCYSDQNLVPLIVSSVSKNIVYKQRNLRCSMMFCFKKKKKRTLIADIFIMEIPHHNISMGLKFYISKASTIVPLWLSNL